MADQRTDRQTGDEDARDRIEDERIRGIGEDDAEFDEGDDDEIDEDQEEDEDSSGML